MPRALLPFGYPVCSILDLPIARHGSNGIQLRGQVMLTFDGVVYIPAQEGEAQLGTPLI